MKIKVLLLLVGVLVIHSKSEPVRFEKRDFNSPDPSQDGFASNVGSYYPRSGGYTYIVHSQGKLRTNHDGSINSNSGNQNSFSNHRYDQGSTSDLRNSDYGSQSSVPSSRPVPQSQNDNYGAQGSFTGYQYNQGPINGQNPYSGSYAPTPESNFPGESSRGLRYPQDGSQVSSSGFEFNQGPLTRPENFNYGSRGSFPGFSSNQRPISGQDSHHGSQYNAPTSGQNHPDESLSGHIDSSDGFQAPSSGSGFNQRPLPRPGNSNYGSRGSFPNLSSNQRPISGQDSHHGSQYNAPTSGQNHPDESLSGHIDSYDGFQAPSFGSGFNQRPVPRPGNSNYGSRGSFPNLSSNQRPISGQDSHHGSQYNAPTSGQNHPDESLSGHIDSYDGFQAPSFGSGFNQRPLPRPGNSNYGSRGSFPNLSSNQRPISGQDSHHGSQYNAPTSGQNHPDESLSGHIDSYDGFQAPSFGSGFNQRPLPRPGNSNYGSRGSFPNLSSNQRPISGQDSHYGSQYNAPTSGQNHPDESLSGHIDSYDGFQAPSFGSGFNQRPVPRPGNSNYGSRGSFPNLSSNQRPISGQDSHHGSQYNAPTSGQNHPDESLSGHTDSYDGSQVFSPGFDQGPPPRLDNSNYGSQVFYPGFTSNQGPISRHNPYHDPQDFLPSSSSDMGSDQNFPLVWQLETTEVIDRDALRSNPNMVMDYFRSVNLWRLQPRQANTNSNNLRHLPKVVLLSPKGLPDYSKPNGTVTIDGDTMFSFSIRDMENPSIDDVRAIHNPHSSEAPIYITVDPNWPLFIGFNNGKVRFILHVQRLNF